MRTICVAMKVNVGFERIKHNDTVLHWGNKHMQAGRLSGTYAYLCFDRDTKTASREPCCGARIH